MWKCRNCGIADDIEPIPSTVKLGEDKKIKEYEVNHYECRNCGQVEYELEKLATWED